MLRIVPPKNLQLRKFYLEKFVRTIDANYIHGRHVRWDIRCFGVPKGDLDIRLVCNRTSSRINKLVWAPSFFLATSLSLSRLVAMHTYQMDLDAGEMFLNFILQKLLRAFCRINLSSF